MMNDELFFNNLIPHSAFYILHSSFENGDVAELADALASGASGSNVVRVQISPSPPI